MPRTPKRLFGPAQVATGPTTVYTVPAGTKTRIRFLWVNNPSAAIVTISVSVGADAAGTRLLDTYSVPAKAAGVSDSFRPIFLDLVMDAAEILTLSAGTNNILVAYATGEENTLG